MRFTVLAFVLAAISIPVWAQMSTGGDFTLEKTVIAAGGGASSDPINVIKVAGTIGQAAAGGTKTFLPFTKHVGFWTPEMLLPTAAMVVISGTIVTDFGRPIRHAYITLDAPDGSRRSATSNSFGYFRLADVEVGNTYIFSVSSRRYMFTGVPMVLAPTDDVKGIEIVGWPR